MSKLLPRGLRNNNPGNINFVGQAGAVMEPKTASVPNPRFARFKTMDDGVKALAYQLMLYFKRGINTVTTIIGKWAPAFENPTKSYINGVATSMRVSPTEKLPLTVDVVTALAMAIIHYENGQNPLSKTHVAALVADVLTPKV